MPSKSIYLRLDIFDLYTLEPLELKHLNLVIAEIANVTDDGFVSLFSVCALTR